MAYSKFTLQDVETTLGIKNRTVRLFESVPTLSPPELLTKQLLQAAEFPKLSEKARGELIVMPILMACRELFPSPLTVYSGVRLDVKPELDLQGECDFIVARSDALFELRAPLMVLVEAKKQDIEAGLGQCVAQMVGSRFFNEAAGTSGPAVYGCVTTGDDWRFMRLVGSTAEIDLNLYYLNEVGRILGVFQTILG